MEKEIQQKIAELKEYRLEIKNTADRLMQQRAKEYEAFLIACLNRTANLLEGFMKMNEMENFLCAAPLIRLNLDTFLRMYASKIYQGKESELLQNLIKGVYFRNLKDRNGEKMTDKYIKDLISQEHGMDWVKDIYDGSSGYVHLSDKHILSVTYDFMPNNVIRLQMRNTSPIPLKEQLGAINIFIRIIENIIIFVENRINYLTENIAKAP